jgi:hypothetical protein
MCLVCMDTDKLHPMLLCMHMCACAQRLLELDASCPVCRRPIAHTTRVFFQ